MSRFSGWLPDGWVGIVAAGFALVLPLLTIRVTDLPGWSGRYALLGVEAAIGLPLLAALMRTSKRRPAALALALVSVATVSALASDNPAMSLWGVQYWGHGLLFVLALAGMWAIGACAGPSGARAVERLLVFGVVSNAVVAVIQVFTDLDRFGVTGYFEQSTGLLGQPAYLGMLLLGGIWLLSARASAVTASLWSYGLLVVVAVGLQLSGERAPLLLAPVVGFLAGQRVTVARRSLLAAVVVGGLLLGAIVGGLGDQHTTATDRIGAEFGQQPRIENYSAAVAAIAERPLIGWGPGRYLAATSPHRSLELAKARPGVYFTDAHNWPLQWAVTTGLVGVSLLGLWLFFAVRAGTGPLLGFALCVGVNQLIQPHDVGVTPIALLAIGAAGATVAPRAIVPPAVHVGLVLGATALACVLLTGMWHAYNGLSDPVAAVRAASWLPHWPDRSQQAARAALATDDGTAVERMAASVDHARQSALRDERDPRAWGSSGYFELIGDNVDEAEHAFRRALEVDPHSGSAITGLGLVEFRRGNFERAIAHFEEALSINPADEVAHDFLAKARTQLAPP